MVQPPLRIILKNPTWLTVGLGIGLVIWPVFFQDIPQNAQLVLFTSLILLTGIPHGALDHLIQRELDQKASRPYSFLNFLVKYLLVMALYGLLWYWSPGLSLVLFLCISALHFGETDLEKAPASATIWSFTRLVYGFYILSFILLSHADEATPIIVQIIGKQSVVLKYWHFICLHVQSILYLLGLSLTTLFIVSQSQYFIVFDKIRLFRLLLILLLTWWMPLLPAFALYFGGWHALCAFDNIHDFLKRNHPSLTFRRVYAESIPFTGLSVLFLGLFLWYFQLPSWENMPLSILFIFISLITLPHFLVTHAMNRML